MRTNRRVKRTNGKRLLFVPQIIVAILALGALASCDLLRAVDLRAVARQLGYVTAPEFVVGEDAARRVLVASTDKSSFGPAEFNIYALDLSTMDRERLTESAVLASSPFLISDGQYLAWQVSVDGKWIVKVERLDSEGTIVTFDDARLRLLEDGRVVVLQPSMGSAGGYELVIHDLSTGQELVVDQVTEFAAVALKEGLLGVMHGFGLRGEGFSLDKTRAHVDIVDIDTGSRERVASDILIDSPDSDGLYFVENQLLWKEYRNSQGPSSRVRAYDVTSGSVETIIEQLAGDAVRATILDASESAMLVERRFGSSSLNSSLSSTFELFSFSSGDWSPVVEFDSPLSRRRTYLPQARIVAGTVVWNDPYTGEIAEMSDLESK